MSDKISPEACRQALIGAGVPAADLLVKYMVELLTINEQINLTGAKDPDVLAVKHIADTFRAWDLLGGLKKPAIDVGSGGGLPGVVLAILSPNMPVTLVERRKKKAAATREIIKNIGLENRINVIDEPFESLKAELSPDYELWFRGVLPGPEFAQYVSDQFDPEQLGPVVLMKGPAWKEELEGILALKKINKGWVERFNESTTLNYELPKNSGSRVLVMI